MGGDYTLNVVLVGNNMSNYEIDKIKNLIQSLNEYRDSYYNKNESLITDKEYDELYDELENLENRVRVVFPNSPTQTVGYTLVSELQKVKHNHSLLSLKKTTELNKFIDYFGSQNRIIMAKLDGLTCSLIYEKGELLRAESRGDGEIGEDITHNAKTFINLPTKIPFKGRLIVDGECIITYDEVAKINKRESAEYKNPRNLVSGSVRQLNSKIAADRNIRFVAWKLYDAEGLDNKEYSHGFDLLAEWGFEVVPYYAGNCRINISNTIDLIKSECKQKYIPIDGIVGMFDNIAYGNSLGSTSHHPKNSLAFKFYQEDIETTLTDIEWSITRTGLVNPVAIFEPVEIDGTTVSRATLSNVSIIKELELGIGDTITVIKSNQIIPKITQNLTRSNTYQIPKVCPVCGKPTTIKNHNGREMLYCTNNNCKALILDKIVNFATRDGMNIVGISEERLRYLMDMGYVTNFESLYHLKEHRDNIAKAKGFGESSIDKFVNAIDASRKCRLSNVIVAIGIPGIGKSAARTIAEQCIKVNCNNNSLLEVFINMACNGKDWSILPGIGKIASDNINNYISNNLADIKSLTNILEIEIPSKRVSVELFTGQRFCITGKLDKFSNREALVVDIENQGGIVVSSVTSKTDYLITNDKDSTSIKNKAAKQYGTKIITEKEYINLIKEKKGKIL